MVRDWIQVDSLRETWIFLIIQSRDEAHSAQPSEPKAPVYWEFGVGNADQIITTEAERLDSGQIESNTELIADLEEALEPYRYQETILITPTSRMLTTLRRELCSNGSTTASLRGFRHLSLEHQLAEYLDTELRDYELSREDWTAPRFTETNSPEVVSTGTIQEFWEIWTDIFRLLPANELAGEAV
jgi:hypothetical protein